MLEQTFYPMLALPIPERTAFVQEVASMLRNCALSLVIFWTAGVAPATPNVRADGPPPYKTTPPARLENSTWQNGAKGLITFRSENVLESITEGLSSMGTWSQQGDEVSFTVGAFRFEGKVTGNRIEGFGWVPPRDDSKSRATWTLVTAQHSRKK
jgi:hypothetical protein